MGGKLEAKRKGPYEVIQAMSKGCYQLKAESGKIMSKLYHGALIKAYMQPQITDIQNLLLMIPVMHSMLLNIKSVLKRKLVNLGSMLRVLLTQVT